MNQQRPVHGLGHGKATRFKFHVRLASETRRPAIADIGKARRQWRLATQLVRTSPGPYAGITRAEGHKLQLYYKYHLLLFLKILVYLYNMLYCF